MPVTLEAVETMAREYTAAWCSGVAEAVSAFYAEDGAIVINEGEPCDGRGEVTTMAQGFMDAFPDLSLHQDSIRSSGTHAVFMWTLTGTNSGPGGTGNNIEIGGWEYWKLTDDCKVQHSCGHFDAEDFDRQIAGQ
ncbi:MAG: steroid delta-isomerase-like uncharacterized protein [Parasphingorhabdus sp.]|jgi:steroid delta-isomerase-like uncharacterized protein